MEGLPLYQLVALEGEQSHVRGGELAQLVDGEQQQLVDQTIAAWLHAKEGKSRSQGTARAYQTTIAEFRAACRAAGIDLGGPARMVALLAQGWALQRASGAGAVAPATYNRRLAIVSSFYDYARKRGPLEVDQNPIALVDRQKVDQYAGAQALEGDQVRRLLASIDRGTPIGLRDYAMLSIALTTGRRVAELAAMRWSHVRLLEGGAVVVTFPRAKGGKVMRDQLSPAAGRALMTWLQAAYGAELGDLAPDAPIWYGLGNRTAGRRQALTARSLENIGHARLGVHFHALRHTFARTLEDRGAKVSEIQSRLGHSSLATTGRYLAALRREENKHAQELDRAFGL